MIKQRMSLWRTNATWIYTRYEMETLYIWGNLMILRLSLSYKKTSVI